MRRRQVITATLAAAFVATTAFAAPAQAAGTDVDNGTIAGRVVTPAGRPAAGVKVTVDDIDTARPFTATTAADGRYAIEVPAGDAYVVSFTDGHLQQYSPRTLDFAQATVHTVREGRTLRVSERLFHAATLTGRLTDETGAPVAGASVDFVNIENAFGLTTTTGADGRYRFSKLAPGPVKVHFRTAGGRSQWAHQAASYEEADVATLKLGRVTAVSDSLLAP
ncbi:carboxypeptidase-like regulatory domain-containing protein [Actinoplanes sp. NPDC048988]|uniref:carboxypeptidase-like regulatory domain-containing protein n=1 Tax=Actinoplanes sp. NPDC048988 TaxID=3363901 RepID=UPI0037212CA4